MFAKARGAVPALVPDSHHACPRFSQAHELQTAEVAVPQHPEERLFRRQAEVGQIHAVNGDRAIGERLVRS